MRVHLSSTVPVWQAPTLKNAHTHAHAPTRPSLSYAVTVVDTSLSPPAPCAQRGPHREGHLAGAQAKADAGCMVMAGAVGNPPEGATFVFRNQTEKV